MHKCISAIVAAGALIGTLLFGGCTQMPTEKQNISDMRPQISFKVEGERALGSHILIDGLDMGMVSDFIDGKAAVRILPGTHIVSVILGSSVLLEEKVYLGDGVSRTFIVK